LARAEPALQGTGRGPRFASVRRSRGLKPRLGSTRVLKNGTRVSPSRPSGRFLAPSRPFQGTDMQNAGADANAIALRRRNSGTTSWRVVWTRRPLIRYASQLVLSM